MAVIYLYGREKEAVNFDLVAAHFRNLHHLLAEDIGKHGSRKLPAIWYTSTAMIMTH
jgi:hypothetical protein